MILQTGQSLGGQIYLPVGGLWNSGDYVAIVIETTAGTQYPYMVLISTRPWLVMILNFWFVESQWIRDWQEFCYQGGKKQTAEEMSHPNRKVDAPKIKTLNDKQKKPKLKI